MHEKRAAEAAKHAAVDADKIFSGEKVDLGSIPADEVEAPEGSFVRVQTVALGRCPLLIEIMIACHANANPIEKVGERTWFSSAGFELRWWLRKEGLVDEDFKSTARGKAWVEAITHVPLPVEHVRWVVPPMPEQVTD